MFFPVVWTIANTNILISRVNDLIWFYLTLEPIELRSFDELSSCFENVWGDLTKKCDVLKIATKFTNEDSLK